MVPVREAGVLLLCLSAAAFLDAFFSLAPLSLLIPFLLYVVRAAFGGQAGENRTFRRLVCIQVAYLALLVFQFAVLVLLDFSAKSTGWAWGGALLGGMGYLYFCRRARKYAEKIGEVEPAGNRWNRFQFRVTSLIWLVAFFALVCLYLRQSDWLSTTRLACWQSAPMIGSGARVVDECRSMILLECRWHPFRGWAQEPPIRALLCTHHCNAAEFTYPARQEVFLLETASQYRKEWESWDKFTGRKGTVWIVEWDDLWGLWGNPFQIIDKFAKDETVKAWTEEEFLKWISVREARAK